MGRRIQNAAGFTGMTDGVSHAPLHTIHHYHIVGGDKGERIMCRVSKTQPTDVQHPIQCLNHGRGEGSQSRVNEREYIPSQKIMT